MRTRVLAARWGTSLAVSALIATLLVLAPTGTVEVATTPSATNTYLCSGYSGCRSAGYSDAGYGAVNNRMYWNMYSGHNCTNYVAYRMIKAGMPNTRPWSGGGNASEWGLEMKSITDQVPNVGAVAWWARYDNGSGSAGHVAYVEKVISSTEIIISEDSWGGTFHWRRLSKDSGRWPTGFIHFVDQRLLPVAPPVVTGVPAVGETLTTTAGTWKGSPTLYLYRWLVGGVATDVTTSTYEVRPEDAGKTIQARVIARRSGYTSADQYSTATAAVTKGDFELVAAPTVTGKPYVDEVLSATLGEWSPTPTGDVNWSWYLDGVRVAGNGGDTLQLTPDMLGRTVSVTSVVRADGYVKASAPRVVVGKVLQGTIEVTEPFTVAGEPVLGETLSVTGGATAPEDAARAHQWLRDGVPIAGATAASYTLTRADVGSRITPRVTLTRATYAPLTQDVATTGVVTSTGQIRLRTEGRRGRAWVRVRVVAPGANPVPGKVEIRVGHQSVTLRLVDGIAKRWIAVPTSGRKEVRVRYLGSALVPATERTGRVRVR